MLTSLAPIATSFSTELSNFSTSFDMVRPSSIQFLRRLSRSTRQSLALSPLFGSLKPFSNSREGAHWLRRIPYDYGGNVVPAARLVREVDQLFRCMLRIVNFGQSRGNLGVRKLARKPVGAEEESVTLRQVLLRYVHLNFRLDTQSAQEHVLHVASLCFLLSHQAAAHLISDE